MNLDSREIGQRIKQIRKENKLTQQVFADSLAITLNAVSKIEPGMRMPSLDLLADIAVKYQINLNWLILGVGKMKADK